MHCDINGALLGATNKPQMKVDFAYWGKYSKFDRHRTETVAERGVSITTAKFVKAVSECLGVRGMADARRIDKDPWKQKYINIVHYNDGLDERHPFKIVSFRVLRCSAAR